MTYKLMCPLRVGVQREVVIEFNYSGMIQFLVDAILSAGMSETKHVSYRYKTSSSASCYTVHNHMI